MKFTTTNNNTYRAGIGTVPKSWIDYNLNHVESIDKYFYDKVQIYDADTCGDETHDFVFEDGKAFRLSYSWYLNASGEMDDDGEELPWVIDERDVQEIDIADANVPDKKVGRDWL